MAEGGEEAAQPRAKLGLLGMVVRGLIFYYVFAAMSKSAKKGSETPAQAQLDDEGNQVATRSQGQPLFFSILQKGDLVDLWVYLSEEPDFEDYNDENALVWYEEALELGDYYEPEHTKDIVYTPSTAMQNNGTLYAHVFFARTGHSPNPEDPDFSPKSSWRVRHSLVEYRARPKVKTTKRLLGKREGAGEDQAAVVALEPVTTASEVISFWKPNMTITLVDDYTSYPPRQVPPQVRPAMQFEPKSMEYYPIVFMNDFWLLRDKWVMLNDTVTSLNLTMTFGPISIVKWQMLLQMEKTMKMQLEMGTAGAGESDEMKRILLDGNPILLGITMAVSLLHSVFDFFAFKNDVSFWRKNKSMEGLSMRSIVISAGSQFVIFLYLLDNDTSWVVLISSGVGTLIEFWKITKACIVTIDRSGVIPMLRIKNRDSYEKTKTREYDDQAMKYLAYVLYPLIACYAGYSLYYNDHKSWYSFVLGSLVGCVYTFGFIMMCPQLYINYRLKSVAHMPWRQMTYKFLNTIIDDLFAFVIKMPTLHRLSVFRDDLIFLIYVYQRWAYRVDMKRVNEYGFGGEDDGTADVAAKKDPAAIKDKADSLSVEELVTAKEKREAEIALKLEQIAAASALEGETTPQVRNRRNKGKQ